jgi:hypothetical protein
MPCGGTDKMSRLLDWNTTDNVPCIVGTFRDGHDLGLHHHTASFAISALPTNFQANLPMKELVY